MSYDDNFLYLALRFEQYAVPELVFDSHSDGWWHSSGNTFIKINSFNPATTISYRLPTAGVVELTIYSILGEKVQTLLNIYQPDGYHKIIWDGMNDQGVKAPSGIYIYRLTSGKSMILKKMILLK